MRALVCGLLLLPACAVIDEAHPLAGVEVRDAWVEDVTLLGMGLIVSGVDGDGQLVIDAANGERWEVPVSFSGVTAGLLIDFPSVFIAGHLPFELPNRVVYGDELFGRYRGSREGITVIGGVQGLHVQNDAGVRIAATRGSLGLIQVLVGTQWLTMKLDLPDPSTTDTSDTGDTTVTTTTTTTTTTTGTETGDTGS